MNFRSVFFFLCITFISMAAKADVIRFDGGVLLYDKGQMDSRDYNGNVEGVTFRFDNGEEAYADRLTIETSSLAGEDKFRIDRFLIRNFTFNDNGVAMAVSSLSIRDTTFKGAKLDFEMMLSSDNFQQYVLQTGRMEMFGFIINEEGMGSLTIDKVIVEGYPIEIEGIASLPIQTADMTVEDLIYTPDPRSEEAQAMRMVGLDRFEMDMSLTSDIKDRPDRVDASSLVTINMPALGNITMEVDVGTLKSSLLAFEQYNNAPENYEDYEFMMMVLSGMFINTAEISIYDDGFMDIFFSELEQDSGISREEFTADFIDQMALYVGPAAPQTFSAFAPAIRYFMLEGGKISLTMKPYGPVPFTSFMSFMAAPDTAMTVLGLELKQTRQ